jgi:WD40 repeat protein
VGDFARLALSADGRTAALSSFNEGMYLVATRNGKVLHFIPQDNWSPQEVVFSPDGKWIATTYGDGYFLLWNVHTGQRKLPPVGHEMDQNFLNHVYTSIAFSPNSKTLVTASCDGSISVWDIQTATLKRTLTDSGRTVEDVVYSPNGRLLANDDDGGVIDLWDAENGRLLATFMSLPSRKSTFAREWLVTTPEGYFDCSANAAKYILWNLNGVLYSAESYWNKFHRPDLVRKALRSK